MPTEIPAELLSPSLEELEEKTVADLAIKWKPRKRPGKKERAVLKHEKEAAKLKAIAEEINKPKLPPISKLDSLFVPPPPKKFSLNDVNSSHVGNIAKSLRPTLRVSLGGLPPKPVVSAPPVSKRGRPPKVKPI
ncbi:MAG: hypothetical protein FWC15_05360 [Fibromonadales bacterium]|nr:hypothetical protein [Fibromonadales bacterium]